MHMYLAYERGITYTGKHGGKNTLTFKSGKSAREIVNDIYSGKYGTLRGFVTLQMQGSDTIIPVRF